MINQPNDFQRWGCAFLYGPLFLGGSPLRFSHLSRQEVVHHIRASLESQFPSINQLLYPNFEIGAVFGRMSHCAIKEYRTFGLNHFRNGDIICLSGLGSTNFLWINCGINWQFVIGMGLKQGCFPFWLRWGLGRFQRQCWLFEFWSCWFYGLGHCCWYWGPESNGWWH